MCALHVNCLDVWVPGLWLCAPLTVRVPLTRNLSQEKRMIDSIFDDNSRLKVFAIRLLLTPWIFTYGGTGHSLKHVWFSRQVSLRHGNTDWTPQDSVLSTRHYHDHTYYICAWGNGAPAHFYLLSDAWELLTQWSFKWRFDRSLKNLNNRHSK